MAQIENLRRRKGRPLPRHGILNSLKNVEVLSIVVSLKLLELWRHLGDSRLYEELCLVENVVDDAKHGNYICSYLLIIFIQH